MPATVPDIDALQVLDLEALKALWKNTFRSQPPPRAKRILLVRLLAYGLQERAFGGLSKEAQRQLDRFARPSPRGPRPAAQAPLSPRTRLMRDWGGRSHEVIVCDSGFSYDGTHYRSLTSIARVITGAHWSGPRFFGVVGRITAGND